MSYDLNGPVPNIPHPSSAQRARTDRLLACALIMGSLVWLIYRLNVCISAPTLLGNDPYTRLYYRQEIVVGIFGRKWLPLMQLIMNKILLMGGGIRDIKLFTSLVGMVLLAAAFGYGARRFGFLVGAIWFALLSVDPDLMFVTVSPYQEILFYTVLIILLWRLSGISAKPEWPATIEIWTLAVFALLCRYEAFLASTAAAIAIAVRWWRDGQTRRILPYFLLIVGFIGLPALGYAGFSELKDDYHSSIGGEFDPARVSLTARNILNLLLSTYFLKFFWLAILGLLVHLRHRQLLRPDVLTFNLFIILFVATYIFVCPYIPLNNRRAHVPIVLWLFFYSGVLLNEAVRIVGRLGTGRQWAGFAAVALLVGPHLYLEWQRLRVDLDHNLQAHKAYAEAGTYCDLVVPKDSLLLFSRNRGNHYGHPRRTNMILAAYLSGTFNRLVFFNDPELKSNDRRRAFLNRQSCGGFLLDRKSKVTRDHRRAISHLQGKHKGRLRKTPLLLGYDLYTWRNPELPVGAPRGRIAPDYSFLGIDGLTSISAMADKSFVQDVRWFHDPTWFSHDWPGDFQLLVRAENPGDSIELVFKLESSRGACSFDAALSTASDFGIVEIAFDGRVMTTQDLYDSELAVRRVSLPVGDVGSGVHTLRFTSKGKNDASRACYFGIAALKLSADHQIQQASNR